MTTQRELLFRDPLSAKEECAKDGNSLSQNPDADIGRGIPRWLGLVTNHRRLFEASQDGWMRPLHRTCFLLGHESFVSEEFSTERNVVPVRLTFDVNKLPFPDARKELAQGVPRDNDGDEPRVVHWRAPIPLYAVKKVEVSSTEKKAHLLAMAGQLSNVLLPDIEIDESIAAVRCSTDAALGTQKTRSLELPENLNSIQGAIAMAVWALPHVEPWIEVMLHALDLDTKIVAEEIRRLDAQWLQLPWLGYDCATRDDPDDQEGLWRAALRCMQWSTVDDTSPRALAERIAQAASLDGTNRTTEMWLDQTRRIIAAEETITCDSWRENGAGLAIQLVLLRQDPMRFKSWVRELPGLPLAVWWAAATLCGWHHGYRALDKKFRGDAMLQEFLAIRALEASWSGDDSAALPPSQQASLERTREDECFTLTWRGRPVVRKQWHSRAKWYSTDLSDGTTVRAARNLADRLKWPCIERLLTLPEGRVRAVGNGYMLVDGEDLVVKGEKRLRLPNGVDVDERFDPDEFRHRLAIEGGAVPDPPEASCCLLERAIPGFLYRSDFITEEEETHLLACIDGTAWSTALRRRVQHYGWRYDYTQRQIDASMRVGELPDWAQNLARRLVNARLLKDLPDQVIVNEYCGRQGIARHIDQPSDFTEHIATISLLETWGMVFRHRYSKEKVEKTLERRSVAVLTGDSRYKWTHEIPMREYERLLDRQGKRRRIKRLRRISVTFRTTRPRRGS